MERLCDDLVQEFDDACAVFTSTLLSDADPGAQLTMIMDVVRGGDELLPNDVMERVESEFLPQIVQLLLSRAVVENACGDVTQVNSFFQFVLERVALRLLQCDPCLLPSLVRIFDEHRPFYLYHLGDQDEVITDASEYTATKIQQNKSITTSQFVASTRVGLASILFLRNIVCWGELGGFTLFLRCLQAGSDAVQHEENSAEGEEVETSSDVDFAFEAMQCIFRALYCVKDHLSSQFLVRYFPMLIDSTRIYISRLPPSELHGVPREALLEVIQVMEAFLPHLPADVRTQVDEYPEVLDDEAQTSETYQTKALDEARLHQLFMIPAFRDGMLSLECGNSPAASAPWREELMQLQKLFVSLAETELKAVDPTEFALSHHDLDGQPTDLHVQMDADEFFCLLLDRVETFIRALEPMSPSSLLPRATTFLDGCFGGVLVNQILTEQGHMSEREEKFFALSVEVAKKDHLTESLELYVQGETLDGENAYYCDHAQRKVSAIKRVCIKTLPRTLVCHLKRFEFDFDTMEKVKINDYLEFPTELDMYPYTSDAFAAASGEATDNIESHTRMYDLVGVVVHSGTADMGHYYSFIRDRNTEGAWFEFNDQSMFYDREDVELVDVSSGAVFPITHSMIINGVTYLGSFLKDCVIAEKPVQGKLPYSDDSRVESASVIQIQDILLNEVRFLDRFLFSLRSEAAASGKVDDGSAFSSHAGGVSSQTSRVRSCTFIIERQILMALSSHLPESACPVDTNLISNQAQLKNLFIYQFDQVMTPVLVSYVTTAPRIQRDKLVTQLIAVLEDVKMSFLDQMLAVFRALLCADAAVPSLRIHEQLFSPSSGILEAAAYYRDHKTLHEYAFLLVEFVILQAGDSCTLQRYLQTEDEIIRQVAWIKDWLGNYLDPHETVRSANTHTHNSGDDGARDQGNDDDEDVMLTKEFRRLFALAERAFGFDFFPKQVDRNMAPEEDLAEFSVESLEDSDATSADENQADEDAHDEVDEVYQQEHGRFNTKERVPECDDVGNRQSRPVVHTSLAA
ncbi:hypothetical protein Poli38472_010309 [Pythium oligandrum]|uniref:ubiquitinyl hydrolase 1 n=1 Tax=Pythium oligandrum TaxID=41045 RepID=A0A8K1FDC4_PYTOL|nr:hypothetical protein Poli38472_010309 [Pythium oligandrum]|eukprot:TMW55427.1 hypothetical protein Poli38472_010309 [Pythium oligandrum]